MKLSVLLAPERIRIPLQSTTKDDVLRELVSILPGPADSEEREGILEAVLEREGRMSTGIGQGVAIPHGKTASVPGMEMTFGIAPRPIQYEALDGDPVGIFFLLLSPPDLTGPHIQTLARISRLLSSDTFREELAAAQGPEDVLALFRREESLEGEDE